MMSITGGAPKELLKLGRRTVLQRVVDEAREAGTTGVIVVNAPDKPGIEEAVAEMGADVSTRVQPEMRGLAHAILCAGVETDALVLLGDCVYDETSPSSRMANLILMGIDGAIAVETVPDDEVHRYGIVDINELGTIRRIVEKPQPSEVASRYAVAARYAFSNRFMAFLSNYVPDRLPHVSGEIGITEVINAAIAAGLEFKAVALQPGQARVDCGTPEEYAEARRRPWN